MATLTPIPKSVRYHPRRHAALRTEDYVFSQLIPYIGNKRKLLPLIQRGIEKTGCRSGTFVDLFTGSTVVARMAKTLGFRVIANDWEPYSYEIARGTVNPNTAPSFDALGGSEFVFDYLNHLPREHGYIATHLCPHDDDNPDLDNERMFFTRENGERIDSIREQIAKWEGGGLLSIDERAYLLSSLLYSVSYASNTSGVFKGFHRGWGGKTGTALYRIQGSLQVTSPILFDNGQSNIVLCANAQDLAPDLTSELGIKPDIVYIDPPYNQHPYGSNYHVLNTVTLWDKPALNPSIHVNGKKSDKSAIRKDWRLSRRSPYNSTKDALPAFRSLIKMVDARWVLVSYSTDGNIPIHELIRAVAEQGHVQILTQRYKRYRVSTPRMSPSSHNVEFLVVLDKQGISSVKSADALVDAIFREEPPSPSGQNKKGARSLREAYQLPLL